MGFMSFVLIIFFWMQTNGNGIFWKSIGKKLGANPIDKIYDTTLQHCLGACTQNTNCMSFNAYQGANDSNLWCELFSQDKCSWEVRMSQDPGVNYFDMIGHKKCEFSKSPMSITNLPALKILFNSKSTYSSIVCWNFPNLEFSIIANTRNYTKFSRYLNAKTLRFIENTFLYSLKDYMPKVYFLFGLLLSLMT